MVSIDHANAEMYFDRDVNCIKRFFERRFHFTSNEPGPFYSDARKGVRRNGSRRLDVDVEASGFSKKMAKELETYMKDVGVDGDRDGSVERRGRQGGKVRKKKRRRRRAKGRAKRKKVMDVIV
jgi:RIO kinase 2